MNDTLGLRYRKILAEVTGMDTKEIGEYLIDFILWGSPDPDNLLSYRLYWAWKAIVMLQEWEKGLTGWALPDQVASNVLAWDYKKLLDSLPKSDQLTVTYSADTWIASAVYLTVEKFIKQSDVPYLEDAPRLLEVGKWYWNIQAECPAFLRGYADGMPRVLMPFVQVYDPAVDNINILYTTSFNDVIIDYGALREVSLMTAELPY